MSKEKARGIVKRQHRLCPVRDHERSNLHRKCLASCDAQQARSLTTRPRTFGGILSESALKQGQRKMQNCNVPRPCQPSNLSSSSLSLSSMETRARVRAKARWRIKRSNPCRCCLCHPPAYSTNCLFTSSDSMRERYRLTIP